MTTPPAPLARRSPGSRSTAEYRWTREKIHAFILALARGRSVAAAARSVGMGRQSAYKLRDRLGPGFANLWAEGRARGAQVDWSWLQGDTRPAQGDTLPAQGDSQGDTRLAQGDTQGDTCPTQGDTFHHKATPKATVSAPN
jgi:hypothetical protein